MKRDNKWTTRWSHFFFKLYPTLSHLSNIEGLTLRDTRYVYNSMPAADAVYTEWHFWNFYYIWDVRQDFATTVSKERHCRRLSEVRIYMDSLCFFSCVEKLRAAGGKEGKKILDSFIPWVKINRYLLYMFVWPSEHFPYCLESVLCFFLLFLSLSTLFDTLLYNIWTTHI